MASRAHAVPITADELDDFQSDGNRYEVIDGLLHVSAAPSMVHQLMVSALVAALRPYAANLGFAVLTAPLAVRASTRTQVEPDLLVLPRASAVALQTRWAPMSSLVLVIEVLSPSTIHVDRGSKLALYMGERVDEYWIVDIEARIVEVWTKASVTPSVLHTDHVLQWQPVAGAPSLLIELRTLFDELL